MSRAFDLDSLRRAGSLAQTLAQKLSSYAPPPCTQQSALLDVHLQLPLPEAITPKLVKLGVDSRSAERICAIFLGMVLQLKRSFESDFKDRRALLTSRAHYFEEPRHSAFIPLTYQTIYRRTIQEWSTYLLQNVTPRLISAQRRASSVLSEQAKRPFNYVSQIFVAHGLS